MKLPPDHHMPKDDAPPPAKRLGEKLMQQMGWQKGQGLGKDGTGRKEHIRVKKKESNEGVGAGASWNWGVKWWEQVFNDQAQALQQKTGPSKKAEEATSSSSQDTAVHQDIPAHNAAAADTPIRTKKVSKKRHKAGKEEQPSGKRKKAKAPAAEPAQLATEASTASPEPSAPAAEPIFGRQWAALEPARVVSFTDAAAVKNFQQTAKTNWWGARQFTSAGQLEGLQRREGLEDRQEFNEDDQVNLYTRMQDLKTSGKGGLGKNSAAMPGEVRKSKYEGSRIVFGEDAQDAQPQEPASTVVAEAAEPRIKYKKLATVTLQQAPKQKLRLKKLEKLVYAQIEQTHGKDIADSCRQQAGLATQVRKSRQFEVTGDMISLAAA